MRAHRGNARPRVTRYPVERFQPTYAAGPASQLVRPQRDIVVKIPTQKESKKENSLMHEAVIVSAVRTSA